MPLTCGKPTRTIFTASRRTPLKGFLPATGEDGDPEQASLAFICKRLKLNWKKPTADEKMAPKDCGEVRLAEKSKPTAGEEVRKRQIGMGEGMEYESGMV